MQNNEIQMSVKLDFTSNWNDILLLQMLYVYINTHSWCKTALWIYTLNKTYVQNNTIKHVPPNKQIAYCSVHQLTMAAMFVLNGGRSVQLKQSQQIIKNFQLFFKRATHRTFTSKVLTREGGNPHKRFLIWTKKRLLIGSSCYCS